MARLKKFDKSPLTVDSPSEKEKSHFIMEGDHKPLVIKSKTAAFRLPGAILQLLEDESATTGQNKTAVLKAALLAFKETEQNQKNHWLLEAHKY